jgi:hypothetical protein
VSLGSASAGVLTFQATGTFQDGGSFSGTFTLDGTNQAILASNLTSTGGGYGPETYLSSGAGVPWITPDSGMFAIEFQDFPNNRLFFFWVGGDPDTFTGGPIIDNPPCACTPSREYDFASSPGFRLVESGNVTLAAAQAPEPATGVLFASALVAMFQLRRRIARRA